MNRLYKRQLVTLALVMLIAFVVLSVGVLTVVNQVLTEDVRESTQQTAQFLSAFTSGYQEHQSLEDEYYKTLLKSMAMVSDCFIFVTELEGTSSFASDGVNFYPIVRNDVSRAVVDSLVLNGVYDGYSDMGGIFTEERYLYGVTYTTNINGTGVPVGFVLVSPDMEGLAMMWQQVAMVSFFYVVFVFFCALMGATYFSAGQVKPLRELADAARRFGQGEMTVQLLGYENRRDEIGDLAREFNGMALSLSQSEEQRTVFINNLSHELRTPMTTITGFAEGILDGTVSEEKRGKALEIILSETRRLSRLVEQMLDLSRLDAPDVVMAEEQFDLVEVLAQVLISMESKILSRGLDIEVELPEGDLLVWGYPDGITQVFYNLLDNATKFASPDTVITVTVSTSGRKAYISVANVGETLSQEDLPKLFQRFHKGDDSRSAHKEGLGLGLYIVKSILVSLRESITVTSESGVTQFTFTLSLV